MLELIRHTIYNARTLARAEANLEQKARAEAKTEHHWQKYHDNKVVVFNLPQEKATN